MRIEQATKRIESLADLQPKPETWEAAMQALIAGAIDYDDIEPLLRGCCESADKAASDVSPQELQFSIQWWRVVDGLIEIAKACCDVAPLNTTVLAEPYLRMGRAADSARLAGAVS